MASTTPLFINQRPNTTTTTKPDSNSTQNPKPRSRRGAGRGQKGQKPPQRGMGVERLELEIEREEGTSLTHKILAAKLSSKNTNNNNINNNNLNTYNNNNNNRYFQNYVAPVASVPVHPYPVSLNQYYFPGQSDSSSIRAGPVGCEAVVGFQPAEIPSIPNHSTFSYKKKRVNGEDENNQGILVGFGKGKEKQQMIDYNNNNNNNNNNINNVNYYQGVNLQGFTVNHSNNGINAYSDFTAVGSEVMAVHTRCNRPNEMVEYGFFPTKPDTEHETVTNTFTANRSDKFLDLSLKLSI